MNTVLNLGKYLFAIPFAVFGIMHLMSANDMAGLPPFGGAIMVYITGLALIAATVSMLIGKMDKLATALLGLMLIIFVLSIWLPGVLNAGEDAMAAQTNLSNLLKDTMLAGGAWMYSANIAKDKAVIG